MAALSELRCRENGTPRIFQEILTQQTHRIIAMLSDSNPRWKTFIVSGNCQGSFTSVEGVGLIEVNIFHANNLQKEKVLNIFLNAILLKPKNNMVSYKPDLRINIRLICKEINEVFNTIRTQTDLSRVLNTSSTKIESFLL